MRYIFVINPKAGQGDALGLGKAIKEAAAKAGIRSEFHVTMAVGDGERFVREVCSEACDEPLRFYACGGDGTLSEVVNGAMGCERAEVGCIPVGTGNDFVRNFPGHDFGDVSDQITGKSVSCDVLRYEGTSGGLHISGYAINMFNIGFDANVVDLTFRMKEKPLLKGHGAYLASVGTLLAKKKGANLKIFFEDGDVYDDKLLLIAIANGCFCGGGVKGIPKAVTDDGLMDISLVKNTSRRNFVRMFSKYAKGTHLDTKKGRELVIYKKCKRLIVEPNEETMKLCIDGEILETEKMKFEIVPEAVRFILPDAQNGNP